MQENKQITVTIEQEGKKVIISLTPDEKGGTKVNAQWVPALEKEKPQAKDFLAMQFLQVLRGK